MGKQQRQISIETNWFRVFFHGVMEVTTFFLTGSFTGWSIERKIKLVRSGHEFAAVYALPRGVHHYKFIVDDQWKYAPGQQTQSDENGNINNVLDITYYKQYNFRIPTDREQIQHAVFHQIIPDSTEYSTDASTIPIILSKSTCVAVENPINRNIPLHCISNHAYHDANACSIFGPHVASIASTQRWGAYEDNQSQQQRYTTYTYVTINPLFPSPSDSPDDYGISNFSSFIACKDPEIQQWLKLGKQSRIPEKQKEAA